MAARREVEAAWLEQATAGGRDLESVIRHAQGAEKVARDAVKRAEAGDVRGALDKVDEAQHQMDAVDWPAMWPAPEVGDWARGNRPDGWEQWAPSRLEDAATVEHRAAERGAEVAQTNALEARKAAALLKAMIKGGPEHPCGFTDCGFCKGQPARDQQACKFGGAADDAKRLMDEMLADARFACPGPKVPSSS